MKPHRSRRQPRWPTAVIELENHQEAFIVPALEELRHNVLLTGHREIVIGVPARMLIDNDALVALCTTAREATAGGADLRIVGADRPVRETLELCQLNGLEFFSSINRALARSRADVTQRARLRWRGTPERHPSSLNRAASGSPS